MNPIPDSILSKLDADTRKSMGKRGRTMQEIEASQSVKSERELQEQCVALLKIKGVFPQVPTFGRKTTGRKGWPDLTFAYPITGQQWGIPCAWELKMPKGELSADQMIEAGRLAANGWCVKVIRSVEQMRDALKELEKI